MQEGLLRRPASVRAFSNPLQTLPLTELKAQSVLAGGVSKEDYAQMPAPLPTLPFANQAQDGPTGGRLCPDIGVQTRTRARCQIRHAGADQQEGVSVHASCCSLQSRSAVQAADAHLKPLPKDSCQRRWPRLTPWQVSTKDHAYQVELELVLP